MKTTLFMLALMLFSALACDRGPDKGSDGERQQQQEKSQADEDRTQSIIYRDLEMQRRELRTRD